jgi:hypothetical protein
MAFTGLDDLAMGLADEVFTESERFVDSTWRLESARIGRDAYDRSQCGGRQAKAGIA